MLGLWRDAWVKKIMELVSEVTPHLCRVASPYKQVYTVCVQPIPYPIPMGHAL